MSSRRFVSPEKTIEEVGINKRDVVIDFGSGAGHWTFAAAKNLGPSGKVIAVDVSDELLKRIDGIALHRGYANITTKHSNLLTLNIDRELLSDLSILANTLSSLRTKDIVLKKVYEFTKAGGKLLVVEWLKEETPIGPPKEKRLTKKELVELTKKAGFKILGEVDVGHYHYGIVFEKEKTV